MAGVEHNGAVTRAYPLRTERLVLRPLREEDIDVVLAYRNDPEVSALQDWDLPVTREHVERQVREHSAWDDIAPGEPRQVGIEADGEPVGFLMWADAINEGTPDPYLWRFLIDRRHQGRGIGARALEQWTADLRAAGHTAVEASWVQERGGPEAFYLKAGFVLTGEMDDDEAVARLQL